MPRPLLLLAVWALLLGGAPRALADDALDLARERGKLIVATDAGYVPFEVINPDGTFSGFDVDLLTEIGKELGLEVELRNTAWAGIIGALQANKVDLIMSGMSVTEERKKAVDFSEPYYRVGQVVIKRRGDERINSPSDLDDPALTIATQEGTTGEEAVRQKFPQGKLLRFPKVDQACVALTQGKADAVVFDKPNLVDYVMRRRERDLVGLWEPFTDEPIGAAFRKDSPKLRAAFDAALAKIRADGRYDALVEKYFPEVDPDLDAKAPRPAQAEKVVRPWLRWWLLPYLLFAAVVAVLARRHLPRRQRELVLRALLYVGLAGVFLTWYLLLQEKVSYRWGWDRFLKGGWLQLLLRGLWLTIQVAAVSLVLALPLGIAVGLLRVSRAKDLRWLGTVYVEIVRGTPLLVQVMIWYYFIGQAFGMQSFGAAVAALSCFTASYIAEIVRAGIQSIDAGQMEAARSLGMSHAQAMRTVILPQAIRRILPPLASEFVALVKDSSLASVIGLEELTKRGQDVGSRALLSFEVWIVVAALYLAINLILSLGVRWLEKKTGTRQQREAIR